MKRGGRSSIKLLREEIGMTRVKCFVRPQMIQRLGFVMRRDEYNQNGNDLTTDREETPLGAIRKKVVGVVKKD